MIKVLQSFKIYQPDTEGGIPAVMRMLASNLGPGFETEVLVAAQQGFGYHDRVDGVPVHRTGSLGTLWSLPLSPTYPLALARRAREVDLVAIHEPFPLADVGINLRLPRRTALIVHWHSEIVAQRRAAFLFKYYINNTIDRADNIIVSAQEVIERSPFLEKRSDKCRIIPFGIDLSFWKEVPTNDQAEVKRIEQKYPRLVVGIGRLVDYKGFDVLIRAVTNIDCQAVIFGEGPNFDELQRKIEKLHLQDRVILRGRQPREEIRRYLHAAKAFVFPSVETSETFGIAQLEAMAAGLPIVNTDLPTAVPTVARDGLEGLTVPPSDVEALKAAIRRLLEDGTLRVRLGSAARERVKDQYEGGRFTRAVADVYRQAVAGRRG